MKKKVAIDDLYPNTPRYKKCPKCGSLMTLEPYPGFCLNCALNAMKEGKEKQLEEEKWNPSRRLK